MIKKARSRIASKYLVIFFLTVGAGILNISCKSEGNNATLGKANYQMELENSKGEKVSMEQFRGKVIFMNVWATWCPPCIKEMPTINNLYKEVGANEEVAFVMLSMDQEFDKAIAFRDKNNYQFEIYRPLSAIPAIYHTKLIPTTFVIDSEGNLVLQHDGMGEFDTKEFKNFLAGVK